MTAKSIFLKIGFCALALAALSFWFTACASGGASTGSAAGKRGLTVEKLSSNNADIEVFPQLGHVEMIESIAFSPDGMRVISGSRDDTIKIWDIDSGRELMTIRGHNSWVKSVVYSPNGKFIASGSGDNTIKIWDAENGKELRTLRGHKWGVQSIVCQGEAIFLLVLIE